MQRLIEVQELIEKAGKQAGSEYKLAKAMGIQQSVISAWKKGSKTCVPEDQARLAAFAKEDALQALVRGVLSSTAGTLRGEQLQAVLGKWSRQTGAASVTVLLATASVLSGIIRFDVLRCILC
ncbi:MAG: hypothetical protein V4614_11105 [Pseudomonadota bacterium]